MNTTIPEVRDPLEAMRGSAAVLRQLIDGVEPERLSRREAEGKWSVREVLAHLADSELIIAWRLRNILTSDAPPALLNAEQDLWATKFNYQEIDPHFAIDTYEAVRRWNLQLLENTTDEDRQKYGIHSVRGRESVADIMRIYAAHDIKHQRQIVRILYAAGKGR